MFQMFLRCTCEEMCTNGTFLMGMAHIFFHGRYQLTIGFLRQMIQLARHTVKFTDTVFAL